MSYYYHNESKGDDYNVYDTRSFSFGGNPMYIKIYDRCTMHCDNYVSENINGGQRNFIVESYEAYQLDY